MAQKGIAGEFVIRSFDPKGAGKGANQPNQALFYGRSPSTIRPKNKKLVG
jgi:hypothetical protein